WCYMNKFIFVAVLLFAFFATGLAIGWYANRSALERQTTSQTILTSLRERGFLVTQTSVVNQTITIRNDQDTLWNKLFWGQVIKANGVVEINLGVDLAKLKEGDVTVGNGNVKIYIPSVEIFNSRVVGDVNIENKQRILKKLLEDDDGYNQASAELLKQATASATTAIALEEANKKSVDEIKRLVGYVVDAKDIVIKIK
ncbi:MAG: DUF4230 domain-containing protein, partial [bacterium]